MTSNIQPQRQRIYPRIYLNNWSRASETYEHMLFVTELDLETHTSRFFEKVAIENALPEDPEIEINKLNSIQKVPMKKA